MPSIFGPLNVPIPRPRSLFDPVQYGQQMAAPFVAGQQAQTQLYQALANVPSQIFGGIEQGRQRAMQEEELRRQRFIQDETLRRQKEEAQRQSQLFPLQQRQLEASISSSMADAEYKRAQARSSASGNKALSAEAARSATTYASGIKSIDKAMEILARDPNAIRKVSAPLGVNYLYTTGNEDLQELDIALTNATDVLLRKRTGAAALPKEIEAEKKVLIGNILTNPRVARNALMAVKAELSDFEPMVRGQSGMQGASLSPSFSQTQSGPDELSSLLPAVGPALRNKVNAALSKGFDRATVLSALKQDLGAK